MKNNVRHSILILILLVFAGMGTRTVSAEPPEDHIEADMILMDDYGNILSHYTRETFQIRGGSFIYNDPPMVEGMSFDTANILELVTEKGSRFRVNYFYTREGEGEDQPLPEPLPLADMPKKGAGIEERLVWVSWTDENMRELSGSTSETYDYYWDAYELPAPRELPGYGYLKLATGQNSVDGEEVPHFAYVYKKGARDEAAPSLLFGHLLEDGRIRTVKAEPFPVPPETPEPEPSPADPVTKPLPEPSPAEPVTKPEPDAVPDEPAEPLPDPATVPGKDNEGDKEPVTEPDPPLPPDEAPAAEPGSRTKPQSGQTPETQTQTKPDQTPLPATVPGQSAANPDEPGGITVPGGDTTKPSEVVDADESRDPADADDRKADAEDLSEGSGSSGVLILSGLVIAGAILLLLKFKKN